MVFAFALDLFDVLVKLCDVFQRQGSDGKEDATILAVGLGGKGYGMLPEVSRSLTDAKSFGALGKPEEILFGSSVSFEPGSG